MPLLNKDVLLLERVIKGSFLKTYQKKVTIEELFFKNSRHRNVRLSFPCVSLILHV